MNQSFDNHIVGLIDALRVDALNRSKVTANNYLKALSALEAFLVAKGGEYEALTEELLADWFVHMIFSGRSRKTAAHYIDNVSGLYNGAFARAFVDGFEGFAVVKSRVRGLNAQWPDCLIADSDFLRLTQLIRTVDRLPAEKRVFADLFIFSLFEHSMSPADVAMLKRETQKEYSSECIAIIERYADTRRQYVFPLGQSGKRPKQLKKIVEQGIIALFKSRMIPVYGSVESTLKSYWAYGALKCGISPTTVLAVIGSVPVAIPVLSVCPSVDIGEEQSRRLFPFVGTMILDNPKQWYAMRLRPGVKFDSVIERVSLSGGGVRMPEFFYPCVEIAKRIGKKLVYKNQPLIADVVFFRSRVTDIPPLFQHIGDLAWCYRQNGVVDQPYAVIPDLAIVDFQTAIGIFTPGMEVYPIGTLELRPDDVVEVVGDMFMGCHGRVESVSEVTPTVYQLLLMGDNGIEWRAEVDRRLVKKIVPPHLTVA